MTLGRIFVSGVITMMALCGLFFAAPAHAQTLETNYDDIRDQGLIFAGICESSAAACECRDEGKCTLADVLQVVVNIGNFILAISGSVTLLIFIYGGFLWITAAGKPDVVTHGKQAMIGAVIGLIIIMGAYAFVTLIVGILKEGEAPSGNLEDVLETDVIDTQTQ